MSHSEGISGGGNCSSSGGGGGNGVTLRPGDKDGGSPWSGFAGTGSLVAEAAATAEAAPVDASNVAEDESEESVGSSGLTRVDSLTLAMRAIQAGSFQRDTSLTNSSGSGSQLGEEIADPTTGSDKPSCRRASSLKVPGSRSLADGSNSQDATAKKVVRFADAMGLDLALVRHVFDLESPPVIPPEAIRDLVLPPSDDEEGEEGDDVLRAAWDFNVGSRNQQQQQQQQQLYLSPSFAQPGSAPNFNSRITAQNVVLETAHFQHQMVAWTPFADARASTAIAGGQVRGFVRVANLGFEKSVRVRASLDNWRSSFEVAANYVSDGAGNGSDQFSFALSLPDFLKAGDRVVFCVAYTVNGETYWDNNFGDNYAFQCVPVGSGPMHGLDQAWSRYM